MWRLVQNSISRLSQRLPSLSCFFAMMLKKLFCLFSKCIIGETGSAKSFQNSSPASTVFSQKPSTVFKYSHCTRQAFNVVKLGRKNNRVVQYSTVQYCTVQFFLIIR